MLNELTAETREIIVNNTATLLEANYVFPDIATEMASRIQNNRQSGCYDAITTPSELCRTLTADLRDVYRDLHLGILYNPEQAAQILEYQRHKNEGEEPDLEWWLLETHPNHSFGDNYAQRTRNARFDYPYRAGRCPDPRCDAEWLADESQRTARPIPGF